MSSLQWIPWAVPHPRRGSENPPARLAPRLPRRLQAGRGQVCCVSCHRAISGVLNGSLSSHTGPASASGAPTQSPGIFSVYTNSLDKLIPPGESKRCLCTRDSVGG